MHPLDIQGRYYLAVAFLAHAGQTQRLYSMEEGRALDIKNIICPVDFFKRSVRALISVIEFTRMLHPICKYTACFHVPSNYRSYGSLPLTEMGHSQTGKRFHSFREQFELDGPHLENEGSRAAEVILYRIKEKDTDLLIMGTTGRTSLHKD